MKHVFLVGFLCSTLPCTLLAADYPVEFSDFFVSQPSSVVTRLIGDPVGLRVDALVSFDEFRLSASSTEPLQRYLLDQGLTTRAAQVITDNLQQGVPANSGCSESLDKCALAVTGDNVQYVFDYDNSNLAIFVGSSLLAHGSQEVRYHPPVSANNALVNQARLYSYTDGTRDGASFSASNVTTLGLPYGYVLFNTQYQNADNSLDVYKGVYNVEVDGFRAVGGYSERERVFFNTTDFLNDDADYTDYSVQVGSSRNLVKGGASQLQSVYFFAPQAGQLEIYQGDRLLLTRVVAQGRQTIGYGDLPTGVYDVRLVLRAGGQVVLEEARQIVNSPQFSLPVGDWDYVLTAGRFDGVPDQDELSWLTSPDRFSAEYAQLRGAWRATDNVLLASAVTANRDDWYGQMGLSYAWSDWLLATYKVGLFDTDDWYQAGTLRLGPLSLSARRFDRNENDRHYRLSSQLYDEHSFINYSANYSTALWGGSGYVSYTHYEGDIPYSANVLRSSGIDDVSAGWMTAWRGWQLGVNTTYSDSDYVDEIKVGLTGSYALGNGSNAQVSVTTDKVGVSRTEAGLTHGMSRDQWHGSGTVSQAWQRGISSSDEMETALSGVVTGRIDWFDASAYGYLSSTGRQTYSGTLTGSQFISGQGAGLTPEMGSSFMHVVPDVVKGPSGINVSLDGVHYNVRREARATYQGKLTGEAAIIPLTPYTDTEFVIDAESRKLQIDNNTRREFVYPGTVYTVDARITPLVTQLFVLNDIKGEPVRQARCLGEACLSVEPLSDDGVFRVSYRAGETFNLVSMNRFCINEPGLMKQGVIHSYCLPGLMPEEGRIAFSADGASAESDLIYLGKYESHQVALATIDRLKTVGLTAQSVQVGQSLYLYVQYGKGFTLAQRTLLEGLEAYIVLNDASMDKLFSAR